MTESPYQPDGLEPTRRAPRRRGQTVARWAAAIVVAVVLVLTVVAVVHQNRGNRDVGGDQAAQPIPTSGSAQQRSTPTRASCPEVTDEVSHLAYRCIDNYLRGDYPDATLGLSTTLDYAVEPNWEIVQGSGLIPTTTVPTLGVLQQQVRLRTNHAITSAYGAHPIYRTLSEGQRVLNGVTGYEKVMEVHIDAAYRAQNHIKADLERLWVLGLPTVSGVAIFMLTIPDNRKDLWPRASATVGTVHVL